MITDNKRKLIYDTNNKFIKTARLRVVNGNIVDAELDKDTRSTD